MIISMRNRKILVGFLCLPTLLLNSCAAHSARESVDKLGVEIINTFPFDETSFTQGLEVMDDELLVGTGWYGESRIYRSDLSGNQRDSHALEPELFGEGVTRFENTIWQLTWKNNVAIQRDASTLAEISRVELPGQGWGLCAFSDRLILSDGSAILRVLDPHTFAEIDRITVRKNNEPVSQLNELECVPTATGDKEGGDIYANIFTSTDIVRIDARTGTVTAVIDASTVPNTAEPDPNHVLNGIAHIPGTDHFYITGKRWKTLYEVRFTANDN
ncbi:glutaminyl-peptide cyclotransferase [Corynebacterium sp. sy039]|nr:glutaminyl-peptide cyclotransferase [Corynebacterium sp. sy039]